MSQKIKKTIQDYENAVCRIILHCLTELPFPLGLKNTTHVLIGAKSDYIIENQLNNLETYSLLSHYSTEQLIIIIAALVNQDLIDIVNLSTYKVMPVLKITALGLDFLDGKQTANISFLEGFVDRSVPDFDELETDLYYELVKLRKELARKKGIGTKMVCEDNILRELTKKKPLDMESLLAIDGIKDRFVQAYGSAFLDLIKKNINPVDSRESISGDLSS